MTILSIGIIGVLVSIFQQYIKDSTWTTNAKKLLVIGLSVLAAAIYIMFKDATFWKVAVEILVTASAAYALVIKDLFPQS